jgi:hypothetical protein
LAVIGLGLRRRRRNGRRSLHLNRCFGELGRGRQRHRTFELSWSLAFGAMVGEVLFLLSGADDPTSGRRPTSLSAPCEASSSLGRPVVTHRGLASRERRHSGSLVSRFVLMPRVELRPWETSGSLPELGPLVQNEKQ